MRQRWGNAYWDLWPGRWPRPVAMVVALPGVAAHRARAAWQSPADSARQTAAGPPAFRRELSRWRKYRKLQLPPPPWIVPARDSEQSREWRRYAWLNRP